MNRNINDDSWKYTKVGKNGKFKGNTEEYFNFMFDNTIRIFQEFNKWNSQKGINHQDKKYVKVFFTSKRFATEIISIGKLKRVLINAGVDRKTIGTIAQISSNDYSKNFFTMEIKGDVNGIVNLFTTFLTRQATLKIRMDLYDESKSKSFHEVNKEQLVRRAELVMQREFKRNVRYYKVHQRRHNNNQNKESKSSLTQDTENNTNEQSVSDSNNSDGISSDDTDNDIDVAKSPSISSTNSKNGTKNKRNRHRRRKNKNKNQVKHNNDNANNNSSNSSEESTSEIDLSM